VLTIAAIACVALVPMRAEAQWWRSAPKDFEECADLAEKAKSKQERPRRSPNATQSSPADAERGGGYTYYDFMQDRSFDIAGPNPTPEEQKKIDQQYTVYLGNQRRNNITAALMAKQQEQQQRREHQAVQQSVQHASFVRTNTEKVPVPVQARSSRPRASGRPTAPRIRSPANGRGFRRASMN
jgi:hypothetical protein